jgi:hypothetical protein
MRKHQVPDGAAGGVALATLAPLAGAAAFASALVVAAGAAFESPEAVAGDSPPADVAAGAGALPEPLKSVAYQPEPLSWNPAAVNCFLKVGFPQLGQSCKGASEIFCNTSLENPQDSHLYA